MSTIALVLGRMYGGTILAWYRTFKQAAKAQANKSAPWAYRNER